MSAAPPITIAPIAADIVASLAHIHLDAFPGSESTLLGYRYALAFVEWFERRGDAIALAASTNGTPVGYVLGAAPRDVQHLYRALLPVVLGCTLARPWIIASRSVRAMAAQRARLLFGGAETGAAPGSGIVLKTIAVTAQWRDCGVGTRLLAAFAAEARQRGAYTLTLSVLQRNASARAFYERRGWQQSGRRDGALLEYLTVLKPTAEYTDRQIAPIQREL